MKPTLMRRCIMMEVMQKPAMPSHMVADSMRPCRQAKVGLPKPSAAATAVPLLATVHTLSGSGTTKVGAWYFAGHPPVDAQEHGKRIRHLCWARTQELDQAADGCRSCELILAWSLTRAAGGLPQLGPVSQV